jgi:hypothetical protein
MNDSLHHTAAFPQKAQQRNFPATAAATAATAAIPVVAAVV